MVNYYLSTKLYNIPVKQATKPVLNKAIMDGVFSEKRSEKHPKELLIINSGNTKINDKTLIILRY